MASTLSQRSTTTAGPTTEPRGPTTTPGGPTSTARRARKMSLAKKGLRSLAFAVLIPFILSALFSYLSGCSVAATSASHKDTWLRPPVWAFHLASITTSSLMGLSAWLVWAEGGFHRDPVLLPLFSAQALLGLMWGPVVFGLGWFRAGLGLCGLLLVAMYGCAGRFKKVNPVAAEMVKPCLAWVAFLAVFTYKLI